MALIRSMADIGKKWTEVTPQRQGQYQTGVTTPLRDWGTNTAAAAERFAAGITAAIAGKRFDKGVAAAGTGKWQKRASSVGPSRWGQGVAVAGPEYATGFAPYRDVIERTNLPPRFSRGDPRNWDRSRAIGQALNAARAGVTAR
jgi:hypothetical protein